jgi:isocitrate/isopropylmalate dehydrogenase
MILEASPAVKMGSVFDMHKLYEKQTNGVAKVKKTLQLYGNISPCKKL